MVIDAKSVIVICPYCNGIGKECIAVYDGYDYIKCYKCAGKGRLKQITTLETLND